MGPPIYGPFRPVYQRGKMASWSTIGDSIVDQQALLGSWSTTYHQASIYFTYQPLTYKGVCQPRRYHRRSTPPYFLGQYLLSHVVTITKIQL